METFRRSDGIWAGRHRRLFDFSNPLAVGSSPTGPPTQRFAGHRLVTVHEPRGAFATDCERVASVSSRAFRAKQRRQRFGKRRINVHMSSRVIGSPCAAALSSHDESGLVAAETGTPSTFVSTTTSADGGPSQNWPRRAGAVDTDRGTRQKGRVREATVEHRAVALCNQCLPWHAAERRDHALGPVDAASDARPIARCSTSTMHVQRFALAGALRPARATDMIDSTGVADWPRRWKPTWTLLRHRECRSRTGIETRRGSIGRWQEARETFLPKGDHGAAPRCPGRRVTTAGRQRSAPGWRSRAST